jgi:hypothetical protein
LSGRLLKLGQNFKVWLPYLPFVLPLLPLLPGIAGFPFPPAEGAYSDLAVSHYPNALYLRNSLAEWGVLPLWSPAILGGYPFAANPLSSLWYPPAWLALSFPLPLGLNLVALAHLLLGGIGMYCLLRAEGLGYPAALLGGLALQAMPKLMAHYGAGHLTLLYAVPLTPWLLLSGREKYRWAAPVLLALVCMADVRWAAYAWILWAAYSFSYRQRSARTTTEPMKRSFRSAYHLLSPGLSLLPLLALAALLAAPLLLPLFEYTRLSTRASLTSADVLQLSLPPAQLLGLVFPPFGGFYEWVVYPGALVFSLACAAALLPAARRAGRFWLVLLILALLLSLGEYLPFLSAATQLPGPDLLRVPARASFLAGIAFSALAAYGVDRLLGECEPSGRKRLRLALTALASFTLALAGSAYLLTGRLPPGMAWGAGLCLAGGLWTAARLSGRLPGWLWWAGLVGLCLLDWGWVNRSLFEMRPAEVVLAQGEQAAGWLAAQRSQSQPPDLFRSYSPSYSLPQQTAARYDLELAEGVDPLQLRSYVASIEEASGISGTGYSVTLPPFPSGLPASEHAGIQPDPQELGKWNVRYLAAEYDLDAVGLTLRGEYGSTRLYENLEVRPRAWIENEIPESVGRQGETSWFPVHSLLWEPNRIEIEAAGPGRLVLAENAYPGWRVTIDGRPAEILVVDGARRGVALGPGEHQVQFSFFPASLYAGLGLALVGWAILLSSCRLPALRGGQFGEGKEAG